MNCSNCGSGIHSDEDLYVYDREDEDITYYHVWCFEESRDDAEAKDS